MFYISNNLFWTDRASAMTRPIWISHTQAITLVDDPTPAAELVEAVNAGRILPGSLLPVSSITPERWFAFLQGDLVVVLPWPEQRDPGGKSPLDVSASLKFILSPRELEVLQALVDGHTIKQIALRLGIRNRTVGAHLKNLKTKLGAQTVEQSVGQAVSLGLVHVQLPGQDRSEA